MIHNMRAPFAFYGPAANPLYALVAPTLSETVLVTPAGTATPKRVTSPSIVCTAKNGASPYTYTWSAVGATSIKISTASDASTTFYDDVNPNATVTGTFKCTVDDSLGTGPVDSLYNVTITLKHETLD